MSSVEPPAEGPNVFVVDNACGLFIVERHAHTVELTYCSTADRGHTLISKNLFRIDSILDFYIEKDPKKPLFTGLITTDTREFNIIGLDIKSANKFYKFMGETKMLTNGEETTFLSSKPKKVIRKKKKAATVASSTAPDTSLEPELPPVVTPQEPPQHHSQHHAPLVQIQPPKRPVANEYTPTHEVYWPQAPNYPLYTAPHEEPESQAQAQALLA